MPQHFPSSAVWYFEYCLCLLLRKQQKITKHKTKGTITALTAITMVVLSLLFDGGNCVVPFGVGGGFFAEVVFGCVVDSVSRNFVSGSGVVVFCETVIFLQRL